ncbi:MAG: choloylglycine hydrolase family protein [Ruminococcaceae bacterium]|nr:choloylglycine hydrolase family protein [Oscillospiraceae bacterium]
MCTSISFLSKDHYFGRTLDLEYSYDEKVVITPREYPFEFRYQKPVNNHFAMIGMATVVDDYPLYYEATNEKGLSMVGLNFPDKTVYKDFDHQKNNICPFEIIPWVLSKCESVEEAKELLYSTNIISADFNDNFKSTPLHWMISDRDSSITVECVDEGLKIYYNPVSVLTNNPEFPIQIFNLNNYMSLTREEPETRFAEGFDFSKYSRGMGALGLPGDNSSMSRFVRAVFTRLNSVCGKSENESISQFFHILGTVSQTRGTVRASDGFMTTIYTSCCNTDKGIYYYTTYENNQISAVNMSNENLDTNELLIYNLESEQQINYQN